MATTRTAATGSRQAHGAYREAERVPYGRPIRWPTNYRRGGTLYGLPRPHAVTTHAIAHM
ncbi:hypothetical protein [uncultured Megasphaera sp.]|uniref:hypothetical protein n=1 Tax=uncultured Megasphaera sp. TaxID=165188 RepID=UPI002596CCBC|nr:hypothetical protein [uncultured Megasphaera sp.]